MWLQWAWSTVMKMDTSYFRRRIDDSHHRLGGLFFLCNRFAISWYLLLQ